MDAKALIADLGKYTGVAARLGLNARTVATWQHRNAIPRASWPDLIEKFPRKVTLARLLETEKAKSLETEQSA